MKQPVLASLLATPLLLTLFCGAASATTWYVNSRGPYGSNCSDFQNSTTPAATIGAAIACHSSGGADAVYVAPGNYQVIVNVSAAGAGIGSEFQLISTVRGGARVKRIYITGNFIIVDGFEVTDPELSSNAAGIEVRGATGDKILNNYVHEVGSDDGTWKGSGSPCIVANRAAPGVSHLTIRGNIVAWCSGSASQMANAANTITLSGRLAFTKNSATVTGSGFLNQLAPGDWIYLQAGTNALMVSEVKTDLEAAVQFPYAGATIKGTGYRVRGIGNGNRKLATGVFLTGDHFLIEHNDISHVTNAYGIGAGSHDLVFRGNHVHDVYGGMVDATYAPPPDNERDALGCVETNSCDTHVDVYEYGAGTYHILHENNTYSNLWGTGGSHTYFSIGTSCAGSPVVCVENNYIIARFDKANEAGGAFVAGYYANVNHWKVYNNTLVNMSQQGPDPEGIATCGHGQQTFQANGFSYVNNLHYNTNSPKDQNRHYFYRFFNDCPNAVARNNLLFSSTCRAGSMSSCVLGASSSDAWGDPKLLATNGTSFALQPRSAAIGKGTFLTTVTSGCSQNTRSVVLADAAYFQDGWGISGVAPDVLLVGGSSIGAVAPGGINYLTGEVNFINPISCTNGEPVSLYKLTDGTQVRDITGTGPDVGAVPLRR